MDQDAHPDVAIIMEKFNARESAESMLALLKEENKFEQGPEIIKVIFLEAILSKARKSLEHVKKIIDKYKQIFKEFFTSTLEG